MVVNNKNGCFSLF